MKTVTIYFCHEIGIKNHWNEYETFIGDREAAEKWLSDATDHATAMVDKEEIEVTGESATIEFDDTDHETPDQDDIDRAMESDCECFYYFDNWEDWHQRDGKNACICCYVYHVQYEEIDFDSEDDLRTKIAESLKVSHDKEIEILSVEFDPKERYARHGRHTFKVRYLEDGKDCETQASLEVK